MKSVSSVGTLAKGVRYNLPRSYYRLKIGKEAEKVKITVAHEIQADDVSFNIRINRNPMVNRIQKYDINEKGLLSIVKTEDVGKLPEILADTAKSIVTLTQPQTGVVEFMKGMEVAAQGGLNNRLTTAEYKHFMDELAMLNFEYSAPAASRASSVTIPDKGGSFLLDFRTPSSGRPRADEGDIRDSLRAAARRVSPSQARGGDDTLLAAGIVARSPTSGLMSYTISVRKEALNDFRDATRGGDIKEAKEKADTDAAALSVASASAKDIVKKTAELDEKIGELDDEINDIEADGKAMEIVLATILDDFSSARKQLETFNARSLKFQRTNEYWEAYGAVLEAAGGGDAKALVHSKAIVLNGEVQKLANGAKAPHVTSRDAVLRLKGQLKDTLAAGEKEAKQSASESAKELAQKKAAAQHATQHIPLIVVNDQLPVIDDSRVQLVPLWRSMVGASTSDIVLVNGVVDTHTINEPSEVLGVVQIPLKVVEAVFDTASTLWTKEKSALDKQEAVLKSEVALIKAQAELEAARKENKDP